MIYALKELVSGVTAMVSTDRMVMVNAAHLLNKSNPKERWAVCAV